MKKITIGFLVALLAVSCKKDVKPTPITEGKMSITNMGTAQNIVYKDIYAYPTDIGGTPERTGIYINAVNDEYFSLVVGFIIKKDQPFQYYQAGGAGYSVASLESYGVNTFTRTENLASSIPSKDIDRGRERLVITKDDKDSLAGNFEIRLVDKKTPVPDTMRIKGSFSVAKKGRF